MYVKPNFQARWCN